MRPRPSRPLPRPPATLRVAALAAVLALAAGLAGDASAAGRGLALGPAPAPDALGPWAVGRRTFQVVDPARAGRTLTVDAWYPVDDEDAVGPPSIYDLIFTGLASPVALDAPPVSSDRRFPLVVFSHGNDGIRFQSFFLCEHLASHGFVVVAPDHAGNTAIDLIFPGTPFEPRDRPLDVSLVISRMLERNGTSGDAFEGRIDPLRIGVAGHSFGGFTALAVASGYDDVPADPRVRAILPISPASSLLDDAELAGIGLPTFLLGGTADAITPIDPQSTRPFALIPARPRYRVDILDAGHNSFTSVCSLADALLGAGIPDFLLAFLLGNLDQGCAPDLIPIDEAHRITNLYATAFLRRYVALDPRYRRWLTPGAARSEPDVVLLVVSGGFFCGVGFEAALAAPLWPWVVAARRRRRVAAGRGAGG